MRISALDVLRGFALCGILLVNVQPIANAGRVVLGASVEPTGTEAAWLGMFAEQRFFPIFSLLFGIGFSLLLRSATGRAAHPRLILLRRLLILLGVGLLHFFLLWNGDILSTYAAVGLLVLLPSSWLPRWAVAGLAAVLVATSLALGAQRVVLVAGLFLLGSALVRYGVIDRIERSTRVPAVLLVVFTVAAVPVAWLQVTGRFGDASFALVLGLAGLLLAGAYVCALLLLLRTPLHRALHVVFAPLGRMALTNYLTATFLVLAITRLIGGRPETWSAATVVLIACRILAVQWVWSTCWLRRFRYGPAEWLWRWATWARRPPLRRDE